MYPSIDTKNPSLVEAEVLAIYRSMYPCGNPSFVPAAFKWVKDWFGGNYPGYLPIDARYHDLEHTLQGLLCMARLLHRRHVLQLKPELGQRLFELGMLAMLMHDSGYLKKKGDTEGTGAKYTLVHVDRSVVFASEFMTGAGFTANDIHAVRNMICCTGINTKPANIPFSDGAEKMVGYALGTADLLGQMSATDYIDKLPILYLEFAETARFNPEKSRAGIFFADAEDLIKKTPRFWEECVHAKLEIDFGGVYRVLNDPYPDGNNFYIEQINSNIARLRKQLRERAKG